MNLEYAYLVGQIADALSKEDARFEDVAKEFAPKIAEIRDEAIAAELTAQAQFFWDAATLLEPTQKVAHQSSDESIHAVVTGQILLMREMYGRLNRRAATVRGVTGDELAARTLLTSSAEPSPQDEPPQ